MAGMLNQAFEKLLALALGRSPMKQLQLLKSMEMFDGCEAKRATILMHGEGMMTPIRIETGMMSPVRLLFGSRMKSESSDGLDVHRQDVFDEAIEQVSTIEQEFALAPVLVVEVSQFMVGLSASRG